MKAVVTKASDFNYVTVKEFNTLTELLDFVKSKEVDHPIILENTTDFNDIDVIRGIWQGIPNELAEEISKCDWGITIYDDYVE